MNREDVEKTFPANTVYLYKENGIVQRATSFNYYVDLGKDYKDCCEALKRSPMYTEVQDETLYQVVRLLEKEKSKARKTSEIDIVNKLQDKLLEIAYQLNDVIDDLSEVKE